MSQRIADCIEVLDLVRTLARHAPRGQPSEWRNKAIAHVASRGVDKSTVFAHVVGKGTGHTISAVAIDKLIATWLADGSMGLQHWLLRSSSFKESERVIQFFESECTTPLASDSSEPKATERYWVATYRVLRDTALARRIKADMDYTCQICATRIVLADGSPYAEAHHIKPLGSAHNGPDHAGNIVCVCPNCHVKLDYGAIAADPAKLHNVLPEFIAYHNEMIHRRGTASV